MLTNTHVARHDELVSEAHGAPAVTHNGFCVTSAPANRSVLDLVCRVPLIADHVKSPNATCVQLNHSKPFGASFPRDLHSYETLRACGQVAFGRQGKSRLVRQDPSKAARRYPRNGFCVFAASYQNGTKPMQYQHFCLLAYPFGPLRPPNLRRRKVWRSCMFAHVFTF